jgi:hypothetical protein
VQLCFYNFLVRLLAHDYSDQVSQSSQPKSWASSLLARRCLTGRSNWLKVTNINTHERTRQQRNQSNQHSSQNITKHIKIISFVCPVRPGLQPTKRRPTHHASVHIDAKTTAQKSKKMSPASCPSMPDSEPFSFLRYPILQQNKCMSSDYVSQGSKRSQLDTHPQGHQSQYCRVLRCINIGAFHLELRKYDTSPWSI